jgi:hypothetical protein
MADDSGDVFFEAVVPAAVRLDPELVAFEEQRAQVRRSVPATFLAIDEDCILLACGMLGASMHPRPVTFPRSSFIH